MGEGDATKDAFKAAVKFVCHLYKLPDKVDTCNKARVMLLCTGRSHETLPPTSDAVGLHIKHAHYQTLICKQTDVSTPELPEVTESGWTRTDGHLGAKVNKLPPVPKMCCEIVTCNCTTACRNNSYGCRKGKPPGTA